MGGVGTVTAHIIVTIEFENGDVRVQAWTGSSGRVIHRAVKKKYPTATLSFGCVWYTNSYGAH